MTILGIEPAELPAPSGPFTHGTIAEGARILHTSGQVALGPDGSVQGENAYEQTKYVLDAIDHILRAAGAERTQIAKLSVYLTDVADRAAVAKARVEYFGDHRPAATLLGVSALVLPALLVEIEATVVF